MVSPDDEQLKGSLDERRMEFLLGSQTKRGGNREAYSVLSERIPWFHDLSLSLSLSLSLQIQTRFPRQVAFVALWTPKSALHTANGPSCSETLGPGELDLRMRNGVARFVGPGLEVHGFRGTDAEEYP